MDGGGAAPCGQLETEWNKESVCTWGCVSAEYQSPSRVRGYVYIRVAWRGCQSLNMLTNTFKWVETIQHFVISETELSREYTHTEACTPTCTLPRLCPVKENGK